MSGRRLNPIVKRPDITEASISKVVMEHRELHLDGYGLGSFGHLPVEERALAFQNSRHELIIGRQDEIRASVQLLLMLGTQSKLTRAAPSLFFLQHLYRACAKHNEWEVPDVSAGTIFVAAKLLMIQTSTQEWIKPDALVCVSSDKLRVVHRAMVQNGTYDEPSKQIMPLQTKRSRTKEALGPGNVSFFKLHRRASFDNKGNGRNTVIPEEDVKKIFNSPENCEGDELVDDD